MVDRRIGVIINGATGRMGTTQHMANLLAIAAEGGLKSRNGDRLVPDLLLVGRDAGRLAALAAAHGGLRWTTNLAEALAGPDNIFMDCAATGDRPARVRQAIAAGKHIHIEKPTAPTVDEAMELARLADKAGLKHGVIQDKLFLPGFAKLLFVKNAGFFGRVLSIKIDAGSWIFDGTTQECQRPSWNYKSAEGGGIALDMMAHWRYMIDRLAAPVTGVSALMSTAIPQRVDELGSPTPLTSRTPPTRCSSSQGALSASSPIAGPRVCAATTRWWCRSTARRARPSPVACAASRKARSARRRPSSAAAGPPTWTSLRNGRRCPIPCRSRTHSGIAGKRFCATSARMRPMCRRWWRVRRQCSSPTWRIAASPSRWMDVPELKL